MILLSDGAWINLEHVVMVHPPLPSGRRWIRLLNDSGHGYWVGRGDWPLFHQALVQRHVKIPGSGSTSYAV